VKAAEPELVQGERAWVALARRQNVFFAVCQAMLQVKKKNREKH